MNVTRNWLNIGDCGAVEKVSTLYIEWFASWALV